jgi:hypothetical protein
MYPKFHAIIIPNQGELLQYPMSVHLESRLLLFCCVYVEESTEV